MYEYQCMGKKQIVYKITQLKTKQQNITVKWIRVITSSELSDIELFNLLKINKYMFSEDGTFACYMHNKSYFTKIVKD